MKQKIKIIRMSVAKTFPATHPRKGEKTYFRGKIICGQCTCKLIDECIECTVDGDGLCKLHTCRANPALWKKRIDEVTAGKAVLVLYEWNGKPYGKDGCRNLFVFGTSAVKDFIDELMKTEKYADAIPVIDSGIGVQELYANIEDDAFNRVRKIYDGKIPFECLEIVPIGLLARNDGLSLPDFKAWFKGYDLSKPMAIIHFTQFRY
jgi:hypothetical protein